MSVGSNDGGGALSTTIGQVLRSDARWCVVEGDGAVVLPTLPAGSINALVTDPPSGIAFMGAEWDRNKGGRAQWVAWLAGVLASARDAMVDGSRAVVWSLPRTSHWTGWAVEDAGFAIETTIAHLFATGWPKGATQLKPAQETWWLARTGRSTPLQIDACRVGSTRRVPSTPRRSHHDGFLGGLSHADGTTSDFDPNVGRYPPNVVLSHHALCAGDVDGVGCVEGCAVAELAAQSGELHRAGNLGGTERRHYGFDQRGKEKVSAMPPAYTDVGTAARFYPRFSADDPDAPYNAPLFRYEAKPSRAEKSAGVDLAARPADAYAAHRGRRMDGHPMRHDGEPATLAANDHPTVKPVALMRWLIRLVTKPGDVVLDPFGGSGTTGVAALLEGRRVILVEREPRFAAIARARCEHAKPSAARLTREAAAPIAAPAADFGPLFGGAR